MHVLFDYWCFLCKLLLSFAAALFHPRRLIIQTFATDQDPLSQSVFELSRPWKMLSVPAGDPTLSASHSNGDLQTLSRSLSGRTPDPFHASPDAVVSQPEGGESEADKKLRKRLKKQQKKEKEGDESHGDDVVAFVLPSGEVLELREYTGEVQSKYDVKIHMANERTFFKYLFAGFHLGAMGTFLITYFPRDDQLKPFLVAATWFSAFSFIFWGLYAYYHRRALMVDGQAKDLTLLNLHGPAYVVCMFLLIFSAIISYAAYTNQYPSKHAAAAGRGGGFGGSPIPGWQMGSDGQLRPVPLPQMVLGGGD